MAEKPALTMSGLVPTLFGHAAFQQLKAGCELGLFEHLNAHPGSTKAEIAAVLELPARSVDVLLLGTTALALTTTSDDRYHNAEIIDQMFAEVTWQVLRDIVEFQDRISYLPATDYAESLRTGRNVGIRHFLGDTEDLYSRLTNTDGLEELFYRGMNSWSKLSNPVLVNGVDYAGISSVLDQLIAEAPDDAAAQAAFDQSINLLRAAMTALQQP
jgi:hypothetical protein